MPRFSSALLLGLLGAALATASQAEIYKCAGPDGRIIFTGDQSQCPGAEAHVPTGQIQRAKPARTSSRAPARAPRRPRAASALQDDAAQAAAWRQKRTHSEARLAEVESQVGYTRRAVKWCNQGRDLYVTDDTGIRRGYSCDKVRSEAEQLERELVELTDYLVGGLEEECRRAGCLPGWIR